MFHFYQKEKEALGCWYINWQKSYTLMAPSIFFIANCFQYTVKKVSNIFKECFPYLYPLQSSKGLLAICLSLLAS